jgi:hypothetical protein
MDIKDTDLAYMAGYIDGEGCIRWGGDSPRISLQSCNPYPLKFIQNLFPCAQVRMESRRTKRNKPVHRLEYSGINSISLLNAVVPYLIEKKDQAEKLIQIYQLKQELKEAKQRKHK